MNVRKAEMGDAAALASLHGASFSKAWSQEDMTRFLETDLVLVQGDPLVALAIIRIVAGEGELLTIAVARDMRGRGLGRAFLNDVLVHIADIGVSRLFLEVATDNLAGLGLYHQCGFTQVGTRKAYYDRGSDPRVDAHILALSLAGTNAPK